MIQFTQFLRPDGRSKKIEIERSPEIEAVAAQLAAAGCRLEAEVLLTGECSFTCERGDKVLAIDEIHLTEGQLTQTRVNYQMGGGLRSFQAGLLQE